MAKMIMMVGPSYSGKSTVAADLAEKYDAVVHSSDAIRGELFGDPSIQSSPANVFALLHSRVKADLREGKNVIYDATNLRCKQRMSFLHDIDNMGCEVQKLCYVVVSTLGDLKKRAAVRERVVPDWVVYRQLCQFQCPAYYEGWDKIRVVKTSSQEDCDAEFERDWLAADQMSHDNPHHTLTVGGHMTKATDYAATAYPDIPSDVLFAVGIHDIGKVHTKRFENGRGEPTEIAHFLGHQNFGAYMAMIALGDPETAIRVAVLIQWHMEHYMREEKGLNKLYNLLRAEGLYEYMKIMEAADANAH